MWPHAAAERRHRLLDAALALALTLFAQVEVWTSDGVASPLLAQSACFAAATLSVAARRVWPLVALLVGAAALTVQTVALGDAPVAGGFLALLVLTYSVGACSPWRSAVCGLAALALAVTAEPLVDAETRSLADAVGNVAVLGLLWGVGRLVRELRQRGDLLEHRAEELEQSQDAQVRLAVAEERRHIARELHDVVAHSVSVMVLQAGAARQHLALDPERARQPLLVVEEVGREALEELHRLLQVLRGDDDRHQTLAGLAHLDQLVEQVRAAGLDVELRVTGSPLPLAPGLDLTAYRVLQEGLTNVLKHAPAARTEVTLEYTLEEVVLTVANEGAALRAGTTAGGHGLIGMRERVQLYGGTLEASPLGPGRFALRSRLPLALAVTGA